MTIYINHASFKFCKLIWYDKSLHYSYYFSILIIEYNTKYYNKSY